MLTELPEDDSKRRDLPRSWLLRAGLLIGLLLSGCGIRSVPGVSSSSTPSLEWWLSSEIRELQEQQFFLRGRLRSLPAHSSQSITRVGYMTGPIASAQTVQWVQVDLGREYAMTSIALVPAAVQIGNEVLDGYGFPLQFRVQVSNDADFGVATLAADQTAADFPNPGRFPYLIRGLSLKGRYVRVTMTGHAMDAGRPFSALGELIVLSGNRNVAAGRPVRVLDSTEVEPRWSREFLVDEQTTLPLPMAVGRSLTNGFLSNPASSTDEMRWVQIDLGRVVNVDEIRLVPARPIGQTDLPAWGFPVRFRIDCGQTADMSDATVFRDFTRNGLQHQTDRPLVLPAETRLIPATAASMPDTSQFPAPPVPARYVRVTATELDARPRPDYFFALAELQVYADNENVALQSSVTASGEADSAGRRWDTGHLVDEFSSLGRLIELPMWLEQLDRRREQEAELVDVERKLEAESVRVWNQVSSGLASLATLIIVGLVWFSFRQRGILKKQTELLRTQIASDLHDDIGSNLGTIALLCQTLSHDATLSAELRNELSDIREVALETGDAMRDIVWLLRPMASRLDDFTGRLRTTVTRLLSQQEVTFHSPEELPSVKIALNWRRNVFLSFKECLHNLARHSRATTATIAVLVLSDRLRIEVSDNGVGFDPAVETHGYGRNNIRKRMEQLGGSVSLRSAPQQGTTLILEAPFSRPRFRWLRFPGQIARWLMRTFRVSGGK